MSLFSTKNLASQALPEAENSSFLLQHFKPNKVHFAQDDDLSDVIEILNDDEMIIFWTKGRWSMHQLIKHLLGITGPSDVTLCTWALTEKPLRVIHNLKETGQIKNLVGLFEHKIKTRGSAFAFAQQFFDEILLTKCHAKVTILEGEKLSVSIMASANLTQNRRIEAGVIFCNKAAAIANKNYMTDGEFTRS